MTLVNVLNRRIAGVFLLALALVVAALYLPFSGNPAVFDDVVVKLSAFDFAQEVFSRSTRTFPYFTIGLVQVISGGDLAWNRYVSVFLHGAVILALYFFLSRVLARDPVIDDGVRRWVVVLVCLWVALNPVAVYATGYLIQRTIVLATLCAILSANLYLRAQQQERTADLFSAALLAGLSVMCKEHAVFLPLAAIALTPLVCDWNRIVIWRALGYLTLSLPCAIWAMMNRGVDIAGTSYEIYSGQVMSQVASQGGFDFPGGVWAMSVATQLLLFWKYLILWLLPNPQWLSADMRIDFSALWSGGVAYVALLVSLIVLLGTAMHWYRSGGRGKIGQLSAVLLFTVIPFLVELSVVRVQEPFVLYRSYLWMPAYALFFCLVLGWGDAWTSRHGVRQRRLYWCVLLLACAALFPMAQDRLRSFSSEEALWQDAQRKLPRPDVAGADRIYYNLAGEAFKRKDYAEALRLSEMVVAQNPGVFYGYLAKGASLLALRELDAASRAFDEAESHQPPPNFLGHIEFQRCSVIEIRGSRDELIACLRRSAKMGYEMARFRLKMEGIEE